MRKTKFIIAVPLLIFGLFSCSDIGFNASFSGKTPEKIRIGQTINFANYLTYDVGVSASLTYSTAKKKNVSYPSLYFQTSEVGEHQFSFLFEKNGKSKELTCTVNVVPNAPSISESTNAVFVNKGDAVSLDELVADSGIDAMPFGNVNVSFVGVTYTPQYRSDLVSLSETTSKSEYRALSPEEKAFTFAECGKYVFDIAATNSEGNASTSLQVSVVEEQETSLPGAVCKGAVVGKEENLVQLMRSNSASSLSYAIFDEKIVMENGCDYSLSCDFRGKTAPQLLLLSDSLHAKKYSGSGFFLSLEEDAGGLFGIYGQERFNSQNLSPKRSSGFSFGRASLLDGTLYRWETHFRKTAQKDGSYRLAIFSRLYQNDEVYRTYDWVSLPADYPPDGAYFGFAGSGIDDTTFHYSPLMKEAL